MNSSGTSILDLIGHAGWVGKLVLLLLTGVSVFSWAIIFTKWRTLARAARENRKFLGVFWSGKNIDEIVTRSEDYRSSPVATVFKAGVKELKKLSASETNPMTATEKVENIQRALVRTSTSEVTSLESSLGWLATTASAAPFVGLFGTVWGIMDSFQRIGASGAANLAVVAPGISEALVATAAGIGAAIPAVVAYNHFIGQIKRVAVDMECFAQDFMNIVQRSLLGGSRKGGA